MLHVSDLEGYLFFLKAICINDKQTCIFFNIMQNSGFAGQKNTTYLNFSCTDCDYGNEKK